MEKIEMLDCMDCEILVPANELIQTNDDLALCEDCAEWHEDEF